jgi:hypothetical protein
MLVNESTVLPVYTKNQNTSLFPQNYKIKFTAYFHNNIDQTVRTISSWAVHCHTKLVKVQYYQAPQHDTLH